MERRRKTGRRKTGNKGEREKKGGDRGETKGREGKPMNIFHLPVYYPNGSHNQALVRQKGPNAA